MKKTSAIITLLILTNIISASLLLLKRGDSPKKLLSTYPLIDVSRNFVAQENYIVNIQSLREKLKEIVDREGANSISLYFEFLNTGANVQINNDLRVWPASLPKVPMAMVVMKKVENGDWSLGDELEIMKEDRDGGYGELWKSPIGTKFTIEKLLNEMLTKSDNTSYRMFLRSVSDDELLKIIDELGLEEMFAENGFVSAKEYSRVFRSLYTSSYLERKNSEQILRWLSETEFGNYLTAGIPEDIKFAHKFGVEVSTHSYINSGIVYVPNRPYILSVAIQGNGALAEEERVNRIMQEIAREAYEYISTKNPISDK